MKMRKYKLSFEIQINRLKTMVIKIKNVYI